jgi:hypothetical protein
MPAEPICGKAMTHKKYRVRRSGGISVLVVSGLYFGIMVGLGIVPVDFFPLWIVVGAFVLLGLQLLYGMYTVVTDTYIRLVQYPFMDVKIPYDKITGVSLRGLPFFGNTVRALFVAAKVKSISHFYFLDPDGVFRVCTDTAYGNEITANIIKTIEQHAPHAKVDPLARAFVRVAESKKFKDSIPFKALKEEAARTAEQR